MQTYGANKKIEVEQMFNECHLPCGMCITATVIPAEISPGKCDFSEYDGNHFRTGIKFSINRNILKLLNECLTLCISEMRFVFLFGNILVDGRKSVESSAIQKLLHDRLKYDENDNHDHIESIFDICGHRTIASRLNQPFYSIIKSDCNNWARFL